MKKIKLFLLLITIIYLSNNKTNAQSVFRQKKESIKEERKSGGLFY
jgi:hypothetical protein